MLWHDCLIGPHLNLDALIWRNTRFWVWPTLRRYPYPGKGFTHIQVLPITPGNFTPRYTFALTHTLYPYWIWGKVWLVSTHWCWQDCTVAPFGHEQKRMKWCSCISSAFCVEWDSDVRTQSNQLGALYIFVWNFIVAHSPDWCTWFRHYWAAMQDHTLPLSAWAPLIVQLIWKHVMFCVYDKAAI